MTRNTTIALLMSVIFHGVLFAGLFYFVEPLNARRVGLSPVLHAHLAVGMISKREASHKRFFAVKKQDQKIGQHASEPAANAIDVSKKQSLALFQKTGKENALMILLHNRISQAQRYPHRALVLEEQGRIEIGFTLFPNGHIENVRVLSSSHYLILDQAAMQAVQSIDPVPEALTYIHQKVLLRVWVHFSL